MDILGLRINEPEFDRASVQGLELLFFIGELLRAHAKIEIAINGYLRKIRSLNHRFAPAPM
ncbi:hypothetical protein AS026_32025 [Rhizobium altiplani]|uniref:Uncharacterized protein n=1 Tax=Rhizobium altiplani TaxID=1864509 RepID=A0A109JXD0_9HYPH|nr:hypothetical protein AS026_32025 [Rhizobium altiplani]